MLSQLKQSNKILKKRLKDLQKETTKVNDEVSKYVSEPKPWKVPTKHHDSVTPSIADCGALVPSSGHRSLLSDHAKSIRGEASKRIDNLLLDWKDYKKKAQEEIRQRCKMEQSLRDLLSRKEKQVENLFQELSSIKLFSEEQKQIIDHLNDELECEAKCKLRCGELEDEIKNLSRCVDNMAEEIRLRDEIINTADIEKDTLNRTNISLQEKNLKLKSKIESCEQDVNATRDELEILDELVQCMQERKDTIVTVSRPGSVLSVSPCNSVYDYRINKTPPCVMNSTKKSTKARAAPVFCKRANVTLGTQPRRTPRATCNDDAAYRLGNKKSALSELRSLQREHAAKCNFLAENIKKLKDESRAKEKKITTLQKSMRKGYY